MNYFNNIPSHCTTCHKEHKKDGSYLCEPSLSNQAIYCTKCSDDQEKRGMNKIPDYLSCDHHYDKCSSCANTQPTAEWEKEWKRLTNDHEFDYVNDGKRFIKKLLESQKQELISKMAKEKREWNDPYSVKNTGLIDPDEVWVNGFNQALDRVIELIKGENV